MPVGLFHTCRWDNPRGWRCDCTAIAAFQAPAVRQSRQQIEHELRRRIQERIYPPGSRMPSRRTLQQELGGSPATVQAAFDQLEAQGYLVARGSRGTFIAERLPGQSTIAVVFNDAVERGSWNRFWSALHRVAAGWGGPARLRCYCLPGGRPEGQVYDGLCTDIADGALAGVVFTSPPTWRAASPLFAVALPRVSIDMAPLGSHPFAASHLRSEDRPVLEAVFARLHGEGRARVAGLASNADTLERIRCLAAAAGLEARPEWWHWLPTDSFGSCPSRRVVHLLGTLPLRQRPDALVITDDNLVGPATSGILDAGWRAPLEVAVAAHANFPLVTHAAVPCLRYGCDAVEVLRAAEAEVFRLAAGAAPREFAVPFTLPGGG